MKNNRGVTLIILIITIIVLGIIMGLAINYGRDTFDNSKVVKFETYMKIIQKKVDIILDDGEDFRTLGQALTDEQKERLNTAISKDSNIKTNDVDSIDLRYFSSRDIENIFNISDVNDEIVINFSNREIISLNGVVINDKTYYMEKSLERK